MVKRQYVITLVTIAVCLFRNINFAADWPHWRGPNRDDRIAEDSGWSAGKWPLKPPSWQANVGEGGSSPLDDEGNLMGFSKLTGERIWTSEYKGPAGHTGGIVPLNIDGVSCVAVLAYAGLHVARIDPGHAGQTVAVFPWGTDFANNIATPAVYENDLLITSAYNHNAICRIHVTLAGATKVWEQPFASKVCTPIIDRGRVYWAWQRVHCLDFETGQPKWEGGEFGDAGSCIMTSDQRLIVWGHRGRLALVEGAERSPNAYQELARVDTVFTTDVWPHVAFADGRLICKDRAGNLKCFSINAEDGQKK